MSDTTGQLYCRYITTYYSKQVPTVCHFLPVYLYWTLVMSH